MEIYNQKLLIIIGLIEMLTLHIQKDRFMEVRGTFGDFQWLNSFKRSLKL